MHIVLDIKDKLYNQEVEHPSPTVSVWDDFGESFSLSTTQRMLGCVMSLAMGVVCLGLAIFFVPMIVFTPTKFAFFFTCGNLFLLSGTMFLVGPKRQIKSMFDRSRVTATILYMASMILTLVAAIRFGSLMMVIFFTCIQVVAFVWYVLSYIPFARTVVKTIYNRVRQVLGLLFRRSS